MAHKKANGSKNDTDDNLLIPSAVNTLLSALARGGYANLTDAWKIVFLNDTCPYCKQLW